MIDASPAPPTSAESAFYNAAVDLIGRNLPARAEKAAFVDDLGAYTYADVNERIDRFSNFQLKSWHGVGVFFLKDGKIVEWYDYTIASERA